MLVHVHTYLKGPPRFQILPRGISPQAMYDSIQWLLLYIHQGSSHGGGGGDSVPYSVCPPPVKKVQSIVRTRRFIKAHLSGVKSGVRPVPVRCILHCKTVVLKMEKRVTGQLFPCPPPPPTILTWLEPCTCWLTACNTVSSALLHAVNQQHVFNKTMFI